MTAAGETDACDNLSLVGPLGQLSLLDITYMWSSCDQLSSLQTLAGRECRAVAEETCIFAGRLLVQRLLPKAFYPSQKGKDPPIDSISVETIASHPIPWQGQGQVVITFELHPIPLAGVQNMRERGSTAPRHFLFCQALFIKRWKVVAGGRWQVALPPWQVALPLWRVAGGGWQLALPPWQVAGGSKVYFLARHFFKWKY